MKLGGCQTKMMLDRCWKYCSKYGTMFQERMMAIRGFYLKALLALCLVCPVIVLGEYSYVFGHRYLPVCLLPAALFGLFVVPRDEWSERWVLLKRFMLPFMPWVASVLVVVVFQGRGRGLHNYGYMLGVFALLFFIFCREKIDKEIIPWALSISLLCVFGDISYGILKFGIHGASRLLTINENCMMGGTLILTVACFAFSFQVKKRILRGVLWGATVLGVVSISVLQVRCCLLGLSALICVAVWSVERRLKIWWFGGVLLFLGLAVFYFLYTGRLQAGFSGIQRWLHGDIHTSWGIRLELWKTTLCGLQIHPLVGWGIEPLKGMHAMGVCHMPLMDWWSMAAHMHNDFFHALARGGIVGASGWLMMQICLFVSAQRSITRRCMLIGIWLGGIGEIYWPYCMWVSYTFMCLWFLTSLFELQEDRQF